MKIYRFCALLWVLFSCSKNSQHPGPGSSGQSFHAVASSIDNRPYNPSGFYDASVKPVIQISFSAPVDKSSVQNSITLTSGNSVIPLGFSYSNQDSLLIIQPADSLHRLSVYTLNVSNTLHSAADSALQANLHLNFVTALDSTDKFPRISDSALLTLVEQQTFKYFWDFGHPVSGLARERNSSGDIVTTGGSGFGVMAILAGISRGFISRTDGLNRLNTVVNFLSNNAQRYHGAFPHWLNGASGVTIPFSTQDDGADLVETSYMMAGLLCARQFFNGADPGESTLRNAINNLWNSVEWNWFRQNGQNVLYWHWSPDFAWSSNQTISGWNEALIVYVLAASSNVDSNTIPKPVYDNGWARNGGIRNGSSYYGITLPLGPNLGGPLFFAHYSFLGINPNSLSDAYANYWTQDTAHTKINYSYCVSNPNHFYGYSSSCWGLTASDEQNGYDAHAPDNDDGVISPTAAISSLPYAPTESMQALRFFYYTLGDRIWKQYGFTDAFNLSTPWFADSFLAIDQGPEIIMIENYRTGLLWNLFMSCPEIKRGMKNLGFSSPNLQ